MAIGYWIQLHYGAEQFLSNEENKLSITENYPQFQSSHYLLDVNRFSDVWNNNPSIKNVIFNNGEIYCRSIKNDLRGRLHFIRFDLKMINIQVLSHSRTPRFSKGQSSDISPNAQAHCSGLIFTNYCVFCNIVYHHVYPGAIH